MRWVGLVIVALGCASSTPASAPAANTDRGPTRADIDPAVRVAPTTPSYRVSVHPGHIDVHSEDGFPGRASDPVLRVGDVELHDYEHVGITTLRFATERELRGPFELHWGGDAYELRP